MRTILGGFAVLGVLAAVACGNGSATSTGNEADLTMDDLPVKLPTAFVAGTFQQVIDHDAAGAALADAGAEPDAGAATPTTFAQRYWYNPAFSKGPDSPVLFYFCGEAACDPWYGTTVGDSARTLGAAIVVLEHRYYGTSIPFGVPNVDQMKYLTIHNALEDAAAFQKFAIDKFGLNDHGKWIAVGGSYPGMLAAFYRLKHPELVAGAWASSAPIGVVKSFPGYDALASRTLGPACSMLTRQAESQIETAFADPTKKRAFLERVYGDVDDAFVAKMTPLTFTGWIMGQGKTSAQYGTSHAFCSGLAQNETDPLEGFFEFISPELADDPPVPDAGDASDAGGAGDASVADKDAGADSPSAHHVLPSFPTFYDPDNAKPDTANDVAPVRQISGWSYQVCSEVGFYQVHNSDRTQSIAPDDFTDAYYDQSCAKQFGLQPKIAETRATYFDPIMAGKATNIFFVNGSEDPWSTLSLTDPSAVPPGIDVLVVRGGSHCEDLSNLDQGMLAGVFQAHLKFNQLARGWLGQSPDSRD